MSNPVKEVGCWQGLEAAVHEELAMLQRTKRLVYHRFYDTRSAGNTMPNQPGDFMAIYEGDAILIEVKFSEVYDSLRSCFSKAVEGHQLASAKLWNRAKARAIILFYPLSWCGKVEVWDGGYCQTRRSNSARLEFSMRRIYSSIQEAVEKEVTNV